MPYPRIFVSHSAKDDLASRTLKAVERKLKAEFDVFIDRLRLQPGQQWRNELFTRMYRSHGAVILFSEPVFDSTFVPTEVSILGSRPYLDPDFKLVPVLLGGVTRERVEERFSAVRLSEIQMVRGDKPAKVAEEVRRALLPLVQKQAPQTPFDKLELLIANLLKDVPQAALRGAAQTLGSDLSVWEPDADLQTKLARELWQADLIKSTQAISEDLGSYLDEQKVKDLVELIAPSWVDPGMAGLIPKVAKGERGRRALAVNGTIEFTAKMFVRRACCRAPRWSWPIVSVTAAWDERPAESLRAEITAALKSKLLDADASDAHLHKILERRETQGSLNEPIFVMFPKPVPPPEVLSELRQAFPTVTFFLLTGEQLPETGDAEEGYFQPLSPGLPPGREDDAYWDYMTALSVVRQ